MEEKGKATALPGKNKEEPPWKKALSPWFLERESPSHLQLTPVLRNSSKQPL
jgi:hypothetical protein